MTITVQDAANIINYLYAAQAITVTDNQHAVWADYINAEMPELQPRDIPVSARLAIKRWSQHGRAWKIDVEQFLAAARSIRADRIAVVGTNVPLPPGLPADDTTAYIKAVHKALGDGATPAQAEQAALAEVGHIPTAHITADPDRIHQILTQAKVKQP